MKRVSFVLYFVALFSFACASGEQVEQSTTASMALAVEHRLGALYADDANWPTRVWLEEPLVDDQGGVLVRPHRPGVLVYLRPDGQARVDFGRHGPHTVPVSQTNFASEANRIASAEGTKIFPNLLGMLMNRVVDSEAEELEPMQLAAQDIRGGHILLVFADTREADVRALVDFASRVEHAGDVRLSTLVPITDELDGDVLTDLRAGGWTAPFVMTPMAKSYVPAMLEPGLPRPFARLCTDEGKILAEGSPDATTFAAMTAALRAGGES